MNDVLLAADELQAVCMAHGWRFSFIGGNAGRSSTRGEEFPCVGGGAAAASTAGTLTAQSCDTGAA